MNIYRSTPCGTGLGVGTYCEQLSQIKNSYELALGAIHISNIIYHEPRIAFSEDLPAYSLLLKLAYGYEEECKAIEADMLRPPGRYVCPKIRSLLSVFNHIKWVLSRRSWKNAFILMRGLRSTSPSRRAGGTKRSSLKRSIQ